MSTDTLYQQLRGHLHYLKLPAVADQLAPALERAERDRPGYTEFLADLLKTEVDATEQRRLTGRLRFSKLPARKTLAQFDRDAQPSLDARMIDELATLQIHRREGQRPADRTARSWFTVLPFDHG